jgi:hypothetical protein
MDVEAVNKNHSLYLILPSLSHFVTFISFCHLRGFLLLYILRCLSLGVSALARSKLCGIYGVFGPGRSGHLGNGHGIIMHGVWKPTQVSRRLR